MADAERPNRGMGGRPGDRWRNRTDLVWWQWVCAMRNPCADCLGRDGRVFAGPDPPVKLHPNCECTFLPIRPGDAAPLAFSSVPEAVAGLPVDDQRKIVGAMCWMIHAAGLVTWYDLFDRDGEPRKFEDVVRARRLSIAALIAAGIAAEIARKAVDPDARD